MKNCIMRFVCMVLCLIFLFKPLCLFAAESDLSQKCRLTLTYKKENVCFSNLEIKIYRVAKITENGSFEKLSPYDEYPVDVSNVTSQIEWNEIAEMLRGYAQAYGEQPYMTSTTDDSGKVVFENLETGLYLVSGIIAEADAVLYDFYDFMICLPAIEDGAYVYDVNAIPKSKQIEPIVKETTYTVMKLWKDEGSSEKRPESVTVDILKDGVIAETVLLSSANNWTYSFSCPSGKNTWSVVERDVPEGYTVKVTNKETTFVIVNTWEETKPSEDKPQTGDITPVRLWTMLFCVSGLVFLILGISMRRKR